MLIFVGLLYYFSYVLTVRNVERYPVRNGFWQTYDAEEDNSIDALFVGDSSIFHSINPMQIWKDKKITTYNLSYAVMKPQEAYFDLKRAFKTQSPKTVFVESQFMVETESDGFDYFTDDTKEIAGFINDQIGGTLDNIFPIMKYKRSWKNLTFSDFVTNHPNKIRSIYKGYNLTMKTVSYNGTHGKKSKDRACFADEGGIYFKKIYNLCKKNNCNVVLLNMPQGNAWNKIKHNFVAKLAKEYNIKYYDFDMNLNKWLPNFSWKTDTRDAGRHLNYSGAKKVTGLMEKYMVEDLGFKPSKVSESVRKQWNRDVNDFYQVADFLKAREMTKDSPEFPQPLKPDFLPPKF